MWEAIVDNRLISFAAASYRRAPLHARQPAVLKSTILCFTPISLDFRGPAKDASTKYMFFRRIRHFRWDAPNRHTAEIQEEINLINQTEQRRYYPVSQREEDFTLSSPSSVFVISYSHETFERTGITVIFSVPVTCPDINVMHFFARTNLIDDRGNYANLFPDVCTITPSPAVKYARSAYGFPRSFSPRNSFPLLNFCSRTKFAVNLLKRGST